MNTIALEQDLISAGIKFKEIGINYVDKKVFILLYSYTIPIFNTATDILNNHALGYLTNGFTTHVKV